MSIVINRESVCMGDDVEGHSIMMSIADTETFTDLFKKLNFMKYFPSIWGNDVVWTLTCGQDDLVSHLTKGDKFYTRFVTEKEPTINSVGRWKGHDIFFKYYSPVEKRAKHIFLMHGGKKFHIWHEGFMAEYEAYNINLSTEEQWLSESKQ